MFYSETILSQKGALAKIWLAAHFERKLSKAQLISTNITSSVDAIVLETNETPMALRLSGQLLLGVVRIYSKKTKYLLEDCNDAILRIKMSFKPGLVDLPQDQVISSFNAITLGESMTTLDLLLPEPALDLRALLLNNHQNTNIPNTPSESQKSMTNKARDVTLLEPMQQDLSTFMSIEDPLDLLNNDPMELEVGRDAPNEDVAFRRESILGDAMSLNGEKEQGLPVEDPFDFQPENIHDFNPMNDDMRLLDDTLVTDPVQDKTATLLSEQEDLPFNLSFDMNEPEGLNHPLLHPPSSSALTLEITKKKRIVLQKSITIKKRKIVFDDCIELNIPMNGGNQLKDLKAICRPPRYVSSAQVVNYMDCIHDNIPMGMERLFQSRNSKTCFVSKFNCNNSHDSSRMENGKDQRVERCEEVDGRMDFLIEQDYNHPTMDFNVTMDSHHDNNQDFNQDFNQDEHQEFYDLKSPTKSNKENQSPSVFSTPVKTFKSHLFPSPMVPQKTMDFKKSLELEQDSQSTPTMPETLSDSTRIAMTFYQSKMSQEGDSTFILTLCEKLSKKDVARLFFETLVLKSKNMIQVEQESDFGDIKVTSLESLY